MHGFGYLHSCKSMMRPHQRDYFVDISLGHFCNKAFHSEVCCVLLLLLIYKQIHIQFYPWSWSHPNNLVFSFDLHERDFDLLWRPRSRVPMNLIKKWKTEHIFSWYHYKSYSTWTVYVDYVLPPPRFPFTPVKASILSTEGPSPSKEGSCSSPTTAAAKFPWNGGGKVASFLYMPHMNAYIIRAANIVSMARIKFGEGLSSLFSMLNKWDC